MTTPTPTPGQEAGRRLVAERGPLPHHLIQSIARRMKKAQADHPQPGRKPA